MMELSNKLSNNFSLSANKKEEENTETQELFKHGNFVAFFVIAAKE